MAATKDLSDESPSSNETLQDSRTRPMDGEKSINDEEKANEDASPQPVGFFNKRLSTVRLQVFGLWARTSQ